MTRAAIYARVSTAAKVKKDTSERIADDDSSKFERRPEIPIEALIALAASRPRRRQHHPQALRQLGEGASGKTDAIG